MYGLCMARAMPRADKRSAEGSNFEEDDTALPLHRNYYSMVLFTEATANSESDIRVRPKLDNYSLWCASPPPSSVAVCDAEPQHRLHQQLRGVGGATHIQLLQAAGDYRNR